jgi:hypothetical protein
MSNFASLSQQGKSHKLRHDQTAKDVLNATNSSRKTPVKHINIAISIQNYSYFSPPNSRREQIIKVFSCLTQEIVLNIRRAQLNA